MHLNSSLSLPVFVMIIIRIVTCLTTAPWSECFDQYSVMLSSPTHTTEGQATSIAQVMIVKWMLDPGHSLKFSAAQSMMSLHVASALFVMEK